jgi:hypothetical protein
MNDTMVAVKDYFKGLLMPRNHGLIAVVDMTRIELKAGLGSPRRLDIDGFVVLLGVSPFLVVDIQETVMKLRVGYPRCIATWDEDKNCYVPETHMGTIKSFSQRPKVRATQIADLKDFRLEKNSEVVLDLFETDSLQRAEFYIQTIITKVKYMVTNAGYYGHRAKNDLDLTDLLVVAKQEYTRKALRCKK